MEQQVKITSNEQKLTNNEQKVTSSKQKVTSNEQWAKSNEERAKSNEQRAKINKQRAKTNEQRAKSNEQRPKTNEQWPKNNEQRAKSFTSQNLGSKEFRRFLENPWNAWNWRRTSSRPPSSQNLTMHWKIAALKHSIERSTLFNFVNLFTIFYPRLWIVPSSNVFRSTIFYSLG